MGSWVMKGKQCSVCPRQSFPKDDKWQFYDGDARQFRITPISRRDLADERDLRKLFKKELPEFCVGRSKTSSARTKLPKELLDWIVPDKQFRLFRKSAKPEG